MKSKLIFVLALFLLFFTGCETDDDVNQATNTLQADAGSIDDAVVVGELLTLDGSASKDNAGRPFDYLWTVKTKPQGSQATLEDHATSTPELTPDIEGDYVVELKISNDQFFDTDEISFTATAGEDPQAIVINANITENRHLVNVFTDPELIDYIVTQDIHITALLQIDPGVTIAFEEDKAIYIDNPGSILGIGSPLAKITFTGKTKTEGFWKGLVINSSSAANRLENVVIEYGGSSAASGLDKAANLAIDAAGPGNLILERTQIKNSASYGAYLESNSYINFGTDIVFEANEIPLKLAASRIPLLASEITFLNNTKNVIEVTGNIVNETVETYWGMKGTTPYLITGKVEVASGLRIVPGTTILFGENAEMQVISNGFLSAVGTENSPVKLLGAEPLAGYWKGIAFRNHHVLNELKYTEVSGAGSDVIADNVYKAAVSVSGVDGAELRISESQIVKSGDYGVYVGPTSSLINFAFNKFENNQGPAIAVPANEVEKFRTHPGLSYVNNGHNGVEIYVSALRKQNNSESIWGELGFGATYLVGGNIAVHTGLKILPGTVLKFQENAILGIFQNGYLDAEGLPDRRITFTGATETKGFWNGILVRSTSEKNRINHTDVLYAGKTPLSGPAMAASIALDPNYSPRITIRNSRIAHGLGYGIVTDRNRTTVNDDVETTNQFEDLLMGNIFR